MSLLSPLSTGALNVTSEFILLTRGLHCNFYGVYLYLLFKHCNKSSLFTGISFSMNVKKNVLYLAILLNDY